MERFHGTISAIRTRSSQARAKLPDHFLHKIEKKLVNL